jgi:hypothetical protein
MRFSTLAQTGCGSPLRPFKWPVDLAIVPWSAAM